jgi:hypothetical protein
MDKLKTATQSRMNSTTEESAQIPSSPSTSAEVARNPEDTKDSKPAATKNATPNTSGDAKPGSGASQRNRRIMDEGFRAAALAAQLQQSRDWLWYEERLKQWARCEAAFRAGPWS